VSRHAIPHFRPQGWTIWSLPALLRALVLAVIAADLAWAAVLAFRFTAQAGDLELFTALLACGAATVELSRRGRESSGRVKDVYAIWELPVAIHLPLLYALAVPALPRQGWPMAARRSSSTRCCRPASTWTITWTGTPPCGWRPPRPAR
jgi:hypothetical protein